MRAAEVRSARRRPPRRGRVRLQAAWVWPDTVAAFVQSRLRGRSLNVCAGRNPLCTVNLDFDPTDRSIIKGDMRLLPFEPNTFDTVVSDPPWRIDLFHRHRPFFECVRVCKIGGRIIYNATWLPESTDVELLEVFVRQDGAFLNGSIVGVFKKTKNNPTYERMIAAERKRHD